MRQTTYILCIFIAILDIKTYGINLAQGMYTIASYNLQNFWDQDPENTPQIWEKYIRNVPDEEQKYLRNIQYQDYSKKKSNWYQQYIAKAKIDRILEVLKLCQLPDIVALQELESAGGQTKVFETPYDKKNTFKTKLKELGYRFFLVGPQDPYNPVSVTTAFISKIELTNKSPIILEFTPHNSSARDIQVAELRLPRERILFFNNHWKSKRGAGSSIIREDISRELKKRIQFERKNKTTTHIIIMGDLNSSYFETPLKILGTTGNEKLMLKDKSDLLYNLWFELPVNKRWEHSFDGIRQTLSHILISDSLYQKQGLHYINQSFKVIGQDYPENSVLLSPDGQPYRWQIQNYFSYAYHIGRGYSDHLPLVAKFHYTTKQRGKSTKQKIKKPSLGAMLEPTKINLNYFKKCDNKEYIDININKISRINHLINQCVKIEVPNNKRPLELYTRGKYRSNYISIPSSNKKYNYKINITMANSFNWRPNNDDSRITPQEAQLKNGYYNSKNPHPQSNKCFQRKVLQGKGGTLRKAKGRLSYINGYLSIMVPSRENNILLLEDLPLKKSSACLWEESNF